MSKHNKKVIKGSSGILQESTITSQGDVQVGSREINHTKNSNNSFQIIFNGSKWLVLGLPFAFLLWLGSSFFGVADHSDSLDKQTQILDTLVETRSSPQPLKAPTTSQAAAKTNTNTKITTPVQAETSSQMVVGVKFVDTDPALTNAIFEAYRNAFKQLDVILIKASNAISYQWELSCRFNPTYTLAEVNGEALVVEGWLETTLYDLQKQSVLGSDSEEIHFVIRDKGQAPQALKQELEGVELLVGLVPNQIL